MASAIYIGALSKTKKVFVLSQSNAQFTGEITRCTISALNLRTVPCAYSSLKLNLLY